MNKKKLIVAGIIVILLGTYAFNRSESKLKSGVRITKLKTQSIQDKITLEGIVVPEDSKTENIYTEIPVTIEKLDAQIGMKLKKGDSILTLTDDAEWQAKNSIDESRIQLDIQKNLVDSLNSQINNAKYEMEISSKQAEVNRELLKADAISSIEVSKSESVANKNRMNYYDLKSKKEVEALKYKQMKEKNNELENRLSNVTKIVKSPIDGIITSLPATIGTTLQKGQKLVSISEDGNYKINVEAPANLIGSIKENSKVTVKDTVKSGQIYEAIVTKVSRVAREDAKKNKVIDIELKVENGIGLNPGFAAIVEIGEGTSGSAKMIDAFSVIEEGNNTYVYMLENDTVKKIPVKIGFKTAAKYEILDLPENSEIIVNPAKVQPGQSVRIIK